MKTRNSPRLVGATLYLHATHKTLPAKDISRHVSHDPPIGMNAS